MCHMTLLSHLKVIQYLTLKDNSVSHTDQFDVSHDPFEPLKGNGVEPLGMPRQWYSDILCTKRKQSGKDSVI
jgi:hypothetical protein